MAPLLETHDPSQGAVRVATELEATLHLLDDVMRESAPRSGPDLDRALEQALLSSSTIPDTDDESFTASSVSGDGWTDIFTTAADVDSSRWGGSERASSNWHWTDDQRSDQDIDREGGTPRLGIVEEDPDEDPGNLYDDPSDGMITEPGDVRANHAPPTPNPNVNLVDDYPGPNTLLNLDATSRKGKEKETVCSHILNGEECTCIDPTKLDQLQKDLDAQRDQIMEIEKDGKTRFAVLPTVEVAGVEIDFDGLQRKYWADCAKSHCK
ncbi:hypothetical protein B0T21DRAFT_356494 [Apiosordaria backusii]|uniref:Uncharacterized protein n=1 Tax=Apiosordaria backusii TaxID=314023 RepID=A0AA40EZJ7_9PEZI|nr:hypothetical protein B0T21DRAFT_356494 [Apiosordaria backusii]